MPDAAGFDGARLALARQLRGLRKLELARIGGVSPAAITQYEQRRMSPRPETLVNLAFGLRLPVDFFLSHDGTPEISEHEFHFRRLRSSKKIDRARILARTALLAELVGGLESRVRLPPVALPGDYSVDSGGEDQIAEIESIADGLRERWQLGRGPISNVVRLLESKGCLLTRLKADTEKVDAFSGWLSGRPFVVLSSDKSDGARSRFDAAHELGHLILHHDPDPTDRDHELQAHCFASSFLMPREVIARELPSRVDWEALCSLKNRWKVSIQALLRRARNVGRITDSQFRRAMTSLSARGWRTREPERVAVEEPSVLRRAVEVACQDGGTSEAELAGSLRIGTEDLRALLEDPSIDVALDQTVSAVIRVPVARFTRTRQA